MQSCPKLPRFTLSSQNCWYWGLGPSLCLYSTQRHAQDPAPSLPAQSLAGTWAKKESICVTCGFTFPWRECFQRPCKKQPERQQLSGSNSNHCWQGWGSAAQLDVSSAAAPSSEPASAGSLAPLDQKSSTAKIRVTMPIPKMCKWVLPKTVLSGRGDCAPKKTSTQHLETFWVVITGATLLESNRYNPRMLLTSYKAEGTSWLQTVCFILMQTRMLVPARKSRFKMIQVKSS